MNEAMLMECKFRIAARHLAAAHQAARAIASLGAKLGSASATTRVGGGLVVSQRRYAYVSASETVAAENIGETFRAWGWELEFDESGNACGLLGPDGDKLGDEDVLFRAVAPFVEDGSYIQMMEETDCSVWRWVFQDGKCEKVCGCLVFTDSADHH